MLLSMLVKYNMEIKDEHIKESEILLINGNEFDKEERTPFIKCLDTCDLLAVPGSGKTTALLAKLYGLSKHLPFNDGSGILILSHTNAAVEEIEKNLKPYCPNLFEYPNYVGTIQSFVNKYLANQACMIKYGSYITQNDDDLYDYEVHKFYNSLTWSRKGEEPKNLKNKLLGLVNAGQKVDYQVGEKKILDFLKKFHFNVTERKLTYFSRTLLKYDGKNELYYLQLEDWKESLLKKGLLNYKDSFNLANWYIDNYPVIKELLQNRFKYVFIDETQDLEGFQIEIIESIFNEGKGKTKIQRIGDINQSIYNSGNSIKTEADWKPRNPKFLNGSKRLTKEVSELVNCFTLDRQYNEYGKPQFIVNGLRELDNPIKPHLILFDDKSKDKLEDKFRELIKKNQLDKTLEAQKYGFKIIGWSAKWENIENKNNKLRLEDIFSNYKKEASSYKDTFNTLSQYLQLFNTKKLTLEPARKAVLNALITILRLENKTYKTKIRGNEVERYYTKSELIKNIQTRSNVQDYETFKSYLYHFSFNLMIGGKTVQTYNLIKDFVLNEFKKWFDLDINRNIENFLEDNFTELVPIESSNDENFEENKIKIDIDTVHSVKGQTHCATMYVETSYHKYESEKLHVVAKKASKTKPEVVLLNPLFFEEHQYRPNKDSQAKEALKMMYVGFSRPTHLLCFAILKENLHSHPKTFEKLGWEFSDLTDKKIKS